MRKTILSLVAGLLFATPSWAGTSCTYFPKSTFIKIANTSCTDSQSCTGGPPCGGVSGIPKPSLSCPNNDATNAFFGIEFTYPATGTIVPGSNIAATFTGNSTATSASVCMLAAYEVTSAGGDWDANRGNAGATQPQTTGVVANAGTDFQLQVNGIVPWDDNVGSPQACSASGNCNARHGIFYAQRGKIGTTSGCSTGSDLAAAVQFETVALCWPSP